MMECGKRGADLGCRVVAVRKTPLLCRDPSIKRTGTPPCRGSDLPCRAPYQTRCASPTPIPLRSIFERRKTETPPPFDTSYPVDRILSQMQACSPVDAALTLPHPFGRCSVRFDQHDSRRRRCCMHPPNGAALRHAIHSIRTPRIAHHLLKHSSIYIPRLHSTNARISGRKMATTTERVQQPKWQVPVPVEVEPKLKVWNSLTRTKVCSVFGSWTAEELIMVSAYRMSLFRCMGRG